MMIIISRPGLHTYCLQTNDDTFLGAIRPLANHSISNHRLSFRRSHLSRDTHLEAMLKRRRHSDASARGSAGLNDTADPDDPNNVSSTSAKRLSLQAKRPSLLAALRLSESRISSRCSKDPTNANADQSDQTGDEVFSRKYKSEVLRAPPNNLGNLLSPLMEDVRHQEEAHSTPATVVSNMPNMPDLYSGRRGSLHMDDEGKEVRMDKK